MKDAGVGVMADSEGRQLDRRIKCRQQLRVADVQL